MRKYLLLTALLFFGCSFFRAVEKPTNQVTDHLKYDVTTELWKAYWIGHATVLIRIHDKWILTDPVFEERVGFLVKRIVAPGISGDKLPPVSVTVVSHLHFDHFDFRSLKQINSSAGLAIPTGLVPHLPRMQFKEIFPMKNWQVKKYDDIIITRVPARHFGGRFGFDVLWDHDTYAGWVIEYRGVTVYFAGDTGRDEQIYKKIGEQFNIDLALVPMGPYGGPKAKLLEDAARSVHLDPEGAMLAFKDLKAKVMVPIHHSTFYRRKGSEIFYIKKAIKESGREKDVYLLDIGQSITSKNGKIEVGGISDL